MINLAYIFICIGIFGILYIYLLYGFLIKIWANLFPKKVNIDNSFKPDITIVIAAHNEANLIENSIRSIFKSNYDLNKIKVLIGSDGSDDDTFEICQKLANELPNIEVFNFPRGGKNITLNKLTLLVKTDFILFMDADILVQKDSINEVMRNFADKEVGAVIAPQIYTENPEEVNAGHKGEKTYQKFESKIKYYESKIYSTVNNIGPFYAVRKAFYKQLPNVKICDDLTSILDVNIAGKRVIYENETFVVEFRKKSLGNELGRRVRVVSGGLESIFLAKELFSFKHFREGFFLFSHKLIRFFSPFFLLFIIIGSLLGFKYNHSFEYMLYLELIFALIVIIGYIFDKLKIQISIFQFAVYFFTMNYGFLKGIITYFAKKSSSTW